MFLLAMAVGMLMPLQTCINTRLRKRLGSPFSAAFASVLTSLLFIAGVLFFTAGSLRLPWDRLAEEPKWIYIGGLCGVTVMTGNILLFPKLGGVQTVIFPILGQIVTGLLIDALGLFRVETKELSPENAEDQKWIFKDSEGKELRWGDHCEHGFCFYFSGDEAPHRAEFRPGWLPQEPTFWYPGPDISKGSPVGSPVIS